MCSLLLSLCWRIKIHLVAVWCLENPRDGGAWWAAVYGVTQCQTRLKRLSSSSSSNSMAGIAILQCTPVMCTQILFVPLTLTLEHSWKGRLKIFLFHCHGHNRNNSHQYLSSALFFTQHFHPSFLIELCDLGVKKYFSQSLESRLCIGMKILSWIYHCPSLFQSIYLSNLQWYQQFAGVTLPWEGCTAIQGHRGQVRIWR